jgi:hypothetical protein
MPVQQLQQCQHDEGDNASATNAEKPAQWQRHHCDNWDNTIMTKWLTKASTTMCVSLKLLGLISCENLWLLIARHSALQERGANDQVIRSLA